MRSLFLLSLRIFPFESSSFGGKSFGGQTISLVIYFYLVVVLVAEDGRAEE